MNSTPDLESLLEKLDQQELQDSVRHQLLSRGEEAFLALRKIAEEPGSSGRSVANAILALREFCLWVNDEHRDAVFSLALGACSSRKQVVRNAAVLALVGICRTQEVAPAVMTIGEGLRSKTGDCLEEAVNLGVSSERAEYVKWFLKG